MIKSPRSQLKVEGLNRKAENRATGSLDLLYLVSHPQHSWVPARHSGQMAHQVFKLFQKARTVGVTSLLMEEYSRDGGRNKKGSSPEFYQPKFFGRQDPN